eukprot:g10300.t1
MGGPGVFTITGEDEDSGVGKTTTAGAAAAVTGAEDTGPFLSADNADRLEEANYNFEDGVLPRIISTSDPPAPYTDKAWSIAFVVNVCVTVIAAVCFRHSIVGAVGTRRRLSGEGVGVVWLQILLMLTICVLLACGLARGAVSSLVRCPNAILQVGYVGFLGLWVLLTIAVLKTSLAAGALSAILCALLLRFFLKRQARIRFGAANLKVAAMAVKSMPGTIRVALLMSIVEVVWSVVSAMAAAGTVGAFLTVVAADGTSYSASHCLDRHEYRGSATGFVEYCECDGTQVSDSPCEYGKGRWVLVCFWLASATWGVAVLKNVVTATVTGSVASWWFSPTEPSPVQGAFFRATHGSFGSLCKAAAVITVMRVLMYPVRRIWLLRRILNRVYRMVGYGLSYAICFISIYGLSFSEALRRVTELFRQRGLTVIVNDTVVSIGLAMVVVCQTIVFFAAVMMMFVVFVDFSFSRLGLISLLLAMVFIIPIAILFWINIEVVRSSHKAIIVCFVQDPDALRVNHDGQTYDDLSDAWRQMQLDCPEAAGVDDHTHTHMQIECTEVTGSDPPHARKIGSPGASGGGGGGATRGVPQV